MEVSSSSIIKKIEHWEDSPLEYDELVIAWNALCGQSWAESVDDFQFADIENAAISALSVNPDSERSGHIGNEISRMLSSFDYPTFMVSTEGRVAAINTATSLEFELNIGDTIDHLPYVLDSSQKISSLVREALNTEENEDLDAILERGHGKNDDRDATIAVTVSLGRVPTALVFVVTTKWKPRSALLLKRQFNLTSTEAELLVSFVDGYSTQDIAQKRKRSHATIRTQLQSILAKTGARNQTELLRVSLSVSDFATNIGVIVDAVNHPYRRRAEILREGGRLVEVTLMGDLQGDPILTIANAANYTFNANIEQKLFEAGLYIISVCTPGCGRTDRAPSGEERLDCLEGDVSSVLNQLNVERCPLMAYNANSPVCYALTNRIPERFCHILHIAACTPLRYQTSFETQSTWATGIIKASVGHPAMKQMLIKGAMKAWVTIGAKQFMRLQMSSNPVDAKHVLEAGNIREYDHALKTATMSGITAASQDLGLLFEDWLADVQSNSLNITIIHGVDDKVTTIDAIRGFAAAFPKKIELIELKNAGMPLLQSHTDEIINLLKPVVDSQVAAA